MGGALVSLARLRGASANATAGLARRHRTAQRVLALQASFTIRGFSVTIGPSPAIVSPFADA